MSEPTKEQRALEIAKKLSAIGPMLKTSVYTMELEGAKKEGMHLAIIHKNPDGSGRVGPMWQLGEFMSDLEELAQLLNTEEEQRQLSAASIAAIFGGPKQVG